MTKTFTAQLDDIAKLTKKNLEYIAKSAIMDVLEGAQTVQIGITQGATSFVEGKIPVGKTAELVNSLTVNGTKGADSYITAIAGFEIGDTISFAWTAPYARRIEMGFTGTDSIGRNYNMPGRFFVQRNAEKFPDHVKKRAKEVAR